MVIFLFFSFFLCCSIWFVIKKFTSSPASTLNGKVVVITGCSSGLGRACAIAFCKQECRLVLCSRRAEELFKLKKHLDEMSQSQKAEVVTFNVGNTVEVDQAVETIKSIFNGQIDILINNAGISYRGSFISTKLHVFEEIMKTNFFGQIALTKAVLPCMLSRNSGHIVAIGSIQVSFTSW